MEKVQIETRLIDRIGVREWGLPTLVMPGQIWRSEKSKTISCMVKSADPDKVSIETLPLEAVEAGCLSTMPGHWRDALLEYVKAWPSSGAGLGPFLRITNDERNALIRTLAKGLSDDIGCQMVAHHMGQLAAIEFELVDPEPKRWRSVAVWPDTVRVGLIEGRNQSADIHSSKEAAEAVCRLLRKNGFGGNGKVFPISTSVEPVW